MALLLAHNPAHAQSAFRIAAVVNNEIISAYDLATRIELIIASSGLPNTDETRQRLAPDVLRGLIEERLQLQDAAQLDITITDAEIDDAIARLEEENRMRKGGLDDFILTKNLSRDTVIAQIRAQLAWAKVVRRKITPQVSVGEEDIDEILRRIEDSQGQWEYRIGEIFLAVDSPEQERRVHSTAEQLVKQAREGANFAGLARQFSQGTSAAVSGDIGWLVSGQLDADVAPVLADMQPGQISDPIRTFAGYSILLLRDRRQILTVSADETRLGLRQFLIALADNANPQEVASQVDLARQISAAADTCAEFEELATQAGSKVPANPGLVRAGDMPADLRRLLLALDIGQASPPQRVPGGVLTLMLCERQAPPSNLPNREQIRERLSRDQIDLLARRYLRDLRFAALVDMRV